MFTGLIEAVCRVKSVNRKGISMELTVDLGKSAGQVKIGDSVAINGACLTVIRLEGPLTKFDVSGETLAKSTLGELASGSEVNVELAMKAGERFGGHFVQGHIDGTGTLAERAPDGDSLRIAVEAPPELLRYLVPKGYVAVDGTSLTVIGVENGRFTFMLVAYTQGHIVLPSRPIGSRVNLEVDVLAKYAEKFLAGR